MNLIYFFLNLNYAEFLCGLFALSAIFTIPKYTRIIGGLCFMLWMIFILFGFVITQGGDKDASIFPPNPYYIEKVVKKYELEDLQYDYPFDLIFKSSTIGFGICLITDYEGSLCSGYLKYFENKLIEYKNDKLQEYREGIEEDGKALKEAIKRQKNIDNYLDKE